MEKGIPFNEREEEKERFGKVVAADATKQAL